MRETKTEISDTTQAQKIKKAYSTRHINHLHAGSYTDTQTPTFNTQTKHLERELTTQEQAFGERETNYPRIKRADRIEHKPRKLRKHTAPDT
jgi:hypothetical protein